MKHQFIQGSRSGGATINTAMISQDGNRKSVLYPAVFPLSPIRRFIPKRSGIILWCSPTGTDRSCRRSACLTEKYRPNAVVLDLELQKGSGSGIEYLMGLEKLALKTRPYIAVVTNNVSQYTHAAARRCGADYIFLKTQSDYSVPMVMRFLRSMVAAIPDIALQKEMDNPAAKQKIEEDYRRRLRQTINRELDMVGISHRAVGRDYLCDAIEMICHKRQTYICAEVAKKYKKSDPSVERAMQNAINSAWRKTDIETLEKCYTAPISSEKGVPTLMEFIFYYADKVKSAV